MNRDQLIRAMAEIVSGLQVPISLGMNLGRADEPWREIKTRLAPGWVDVDTVEEKLREVLGATAPDALGCTPPTTDMKGQP